MRDAESVPLEIFSLYTLPLAISACQSPYRPGQICRRYHIGAGHLMTLENSFNVNTIYSNIPLLDFDSKNSVM